MFNYIFLGMVLVVVIVSAVWNPWKNLLQFMRAQSALQGSREKNAKLMMAALAKCLVMPIVLILITVLYFFVKGSHAHAYEASVVREATCSEEGILQYRCRLCNDTYEEAIPLIDHSYAKEAVSRTDATCIKEGELVYACEACGATYTEKLPLIDHRYAVVSHTDATCTEEGESAYTCEMCGDSYTETLSLTEHKYAVTERVDPSCTQEGMASYVCEACGNAYTEVLPMTEHGYVETARSAAGCATTGWVYYYCQICGKESAKVLPANGKHQYIATSNDTEKGTVSYICRICGQEYVEELSELSQGETSKSESAAGSAGRSTLRIIMILVAIAAALAVIFFLIKASESRKWGRVLLPLIILVADIIFLVRGNSPSSGSVQEVMVQRIGSTVTFGPYKWQILSVQDGKMLLLAEEILEQRKYHSSQENITWENCDLRRYLNEEFLQNFSSEDQSQMIETENVNADNQMYGTHGGSSTTDKIFLLSIDEALQYFGDGSQIKEQDKAVSDQFNNARIAKNSKGEAGWWWLRSPGSSAIDAARVGNDGSLGMGGYIVNLDDGGVRPALWIRTQESADSETTQTQPTEADVEVDVEPVFADSSPVSIAQAAASSALSNEFAIEYSYDGNVNTCWQDGDPGNGTKQNLIYYFGQPKYIVGMDIINGRAVSEESYLNNNRIMFMTLYYFLNGTVTASVRVELDDSYRVKPVYYELTDGSEEEKYYCDGIQIVIDSVYTGKRFNDLGLTEIRFYEGDRSY